MIQRTLCERYELVRKIGNGGMAEVYEAYDNLLDRTVAVKILHAVYRSDAEFIEKFHREAKSAARLSHPNIVNIFDVGVDGDDHFIVMEYVTGNSLKKKITDEGALDILTATKIAKDIANGLAHAHANNIVHCDIKPHNILMTSDGRAKIADFGIARAVTESTMTYSGNIIGSVHYFSPEQAQGGTITPKSDVYSLGIVMYEMLTHRLPFTGENAVAIAMKHIEEEPIPPSNYRSQIPPMLEAIVLRTMNKNPDLRPSSFDLIQALSNVEANLAVNQPKDPDATKVLPRIQTETLPPRRNIRQVTKESPRKEKSFFKSKLFLFGLVFLLLTGFGVGIFAAYGNVLLNEEIISVPNVKSKQLVLARQILEDSDLRVNVAEIYDANVPAGQVVSQDPVGGREVKSGRVITIYVSKGGETIDLPDLVGLTKSAAIERINKLGLKVGKIYEKDSYYDEPGQVLSHDPAVGTKINRGQTVDLIVSRGYGNSDNGDSYNTSTKSMPQKIYVPDVRNATLSEAKDFILDSGLSVGSITYQESSQSDGLIISQNPAPNAGVDAGTSVDLIVSQYYEESPPVQDNTIIYDNTEPPLDNENVHEEKFAEAVEEMSPPVDDAPSRDDGGTRR